MLGKKITVTVAQPEVQLAGEGRKVLYKGSVALGDHSSPKPVYLISYGDPKPEQPATVIAVVSSKGKEQFVAAPENTVYYAPEIRSVIEKAEGRPPERVSCLYEKSCGAVVYRVEALGVSQGAHGVWGKRAPDRPAGGAGGNRPKSGDTAGVPGNL